MGKHCSSLSGMHFSRAHPESQAYGAIPGGTIVGPFIEVRTVKNLEEFGLEISIPSISILKRHLTL